MDNMAENKTVIDDAIADVSGAFEEQITVKQFVSYGEVPADGLTPTITYKLLPTTAVVDDIGQEKMASAGGFIALGDLQMQIRTIKLQEPNSSHPGDRIIYDGAEYTLVQKPMIEYLSGVIYYTCICRRVV